jgi:hypothetical protein
MLKEINVFGVYFAPFAGYVVLAIVLFVPLRKWFDRIEVQRWFWHRALFDTATFAILLCVLGLLLMF